MLKHTSDPYELIIVDNSTGIVEKKKKIYDRWEKLFIGVFERQEQYIKKVVKVQSSIRMMLQYKRIRQFLRLILQTKWGKIVHAAVEIQRVYRGFSSRKRVAIDRVHDAILQKERDKVQALQFQLKKKEEDKFDEINRIWLDKLNEYKETHKDEKEEIKHYIRPGLETPSHKIRNYNKRLCINDDSQSPLGQSVVKIKYGSLEPYKGLHISREWEQWGMRQKGYCVDQEGKYTRTEYYKQLFQAPEPVYQSDRDLPTPMFLSEIKNKPDSGETVNFDNKNRSSVPSFPSITKVVIKDEKFVDEVPKINKDDPRSSQYEIIQTLPFVTGRSQKVKTLPVLYTMNDEIKQKIIGTKLKRKKEIEEFAKLSMSQIGWESKILRARSTKEKVLNTNCEQLISKNKTIQERVLRKHEQIYRDEIQRRIDNIRTKDDEFERRIGNKNTTLSTIHMNDSSIYESNSLLYRYEKKKI